MNLEKEYLKGNKTKMTVARIFTAVVILYCVVYSINISNWVNSAEEYTNTDNKYYADPDTVHNSVYDPHGVLKNATIKAIRDANLKMMEKYNVKAIVALVGQTELAGRDVEEYTIDYFNDNYLEYSNDTFIVINIDTGGYWMEFGNGIYNHAVSDKNYAGDYFDVLEKNIDTGAYDDAVTLYADRTLRMYETYDNSTNNLSYTYYDNSFGYSYAANIFGAVFVIAVIIIIIAAIASSGGSARRYRYVTYYPHRRIFRANRYNFYRYQNRMPPPPHIHGGFWGPGYRGGAKKSDSTWRNDSFNRNSSSGGFGNKGSHSNNWSSSGKSGGWSSNSGGRSSSGGGFGRSSGSSGRSSSGGFGKSSGGGFGRGSGGGRGSSGGGFGRKK